MRLKKDGEVVREFVHPRNLRREWTAPEEVMTDEMMTDEMISDEVATN